MKKEAKTKSVILLNSISECMKVITLLEEAGKIEEVDLRYRGETCPFASRQNTGMPIDQAHKVLLLNQGGRIKMRSPPKVLTGNFRPSQLSFFLS